MKNTIGESARRSAIPALVRRIMRWVLVAVLVLTLPGLLMLSAIGFADLSISPNARPNALLEFAVVIVLMWGIWFGAAAWVIRSFRG